MAQKVISQKYFFTVTLKPRMFKYDAEKQYDMTQGALCEILNSMDANGKVTAELTKAFNIHYHGLVDFRTALKYPQKYFVDNLRRVEAIGYVKIEPALHEQKVKEYIEKDVSKTLDMIQREPIIFNKLYRVHVTRFDDYEDFCAEAANA